MISIKARNKIIAGKYQEFRFKIKRGRLYLYCLENELVIDSSSILSVYEMSCREIPNEISMLARGYVGKLFLGLLGMLVGLSTAKTIKIYRVQINFTEGGTGIAEVDNQIYEKLLQIIWGYM